MPLGPPHHRVDRGRQRSLEPPRRHQIYVVDSGEVANSREVVDGRGSRGGHGGGQEEVEGRSAPRQPELAQGGAHGLTHGVYRMAAWGEEGGQLEDKVEKIKGENKSQ